MEALSKDKRSFSSAKNGILGGRPISTATLTTQEARKWLSEETTRRLVPLYEVLYLKAIDGDITAIKELLDRSYGKPIQGVELAGKDGNPLIFLPLELIQKHNLPIKAESILIDTPIKESQ